MFVHLAIRFTNNQMTIAYTALIAIVISKGLTVMNILGKAPIMVYQRAMHITDVNYVLKSLTRKCTRKGTSAANHIAKLVRITSIQIIYVVDEIHLDKSLPILQYLFKNAIIPKIIPSEAKHMSVEVPSFNIRMIDSINFPPVALSELLIMFGLNELTKGYFQHLYNRTANQGIVMSHLPEILYYNPDSMSADPSKASNRKLFL